MANATSGQWARIRTLGRGASGAVVWLAADAASGELFAVKSTGGTEDAAAQLRREQEILSGLCSPYIVRCIDGCGGHRDGGEYNLFLEFAPGGSLAEEVERNGGRLEERAIRAYAADVLSGLEYLHGESLVHGDIKAKNILIGVDGRAKIADFGCARTLDSVRPIGGTPAFMAPEVARGEEQGPAADVWALGCTIIEMATGRSPWSDMDDFLAAVYRIGYTDAVPDVPMWLSTEAKDFLAVCFARNARDRCTAAELLEHPFVALACCAEAGEAKARWVSPKSTLDAAFWESETEEEEEEDENSESPFERIKSLSCTVSALPDWGSGEGWIDVLGDHCEVRDSPATKVPADVALSVPSKMSGSTMVPAEDMVVAGSLSIEEPETEDQDEPFGGDVLAADPSIDHPNDACFSSDRNYVPPFQIPYNGIKVMENFQFLQICLAVHNLIFCSCNCECLSVSGSKDHRAVSHFYWIRKQNKQDYYIFSKKRKTLLFKKDITISEELKRRIGDSIVFL